MHLLLQGNTLHLCGSNGVKGQGPNTVKVQILEKTCDGRLSWVKATYPGSLALQVLTLSLGASGVIVACFAARFCVQGPPDRDHVTGSLAMSCLEGTSSSPIVPVCQAYAARAETRFGQTIKLFLRGNIPLGQGVFDLTT